MIYIKQVYVEKSFIRSLIILISLCIFSLPAWSQTEVEGTLLEDTTWTVEGSPYTLTGDLTVPEGVTLTIDPRVVVMLGVDDALESGEFPTEVEFTIEGTLFARGYEDAEVTIYGNPYGMGIGLRLNPSATLPNDILSHIQFEGGFFAPLVNNRTAPLTTFDQISCANQRDDYLLINGTGSTTLNGITNCIVAVRQLRTDHTLTISNSEISAIGSYAPATTGDIEIVESTVHARRIGCHGFLPQDRSNASFYPTELAIAQSTDCHYIPFANDPRPLRSEGGRGQFVGFAYPISRYWPPTTSPAPGEAPAYVNGTATLLGPLERVAFHTHDRGSFSQLSHYGAGPHPGADRHSHYNAAGATITVTVPQGHNTLYYSPYRSTAVTGRVRDNGESTFRETCSHTDYPRYDSYNCASSDWWTTNVIIQHDSTEASHFHSTLTARRISIRDSILDGSTRPSMTERLRLQASEIRMDHVDVSSWGAEGLILTGNPVLNDGHSAHLSGSHFTDTALSISGNSVLEESSFDGQPVQLQGEVDILGSVFRSAALTATGVTSVEIEHTKFLGSAGASPVVIERGDDQLVTPDVTIRNSLVYMADFSAAFTLRQTGGLVSNTTITRAEPGGSGVVIDEGLVRVRHLAAHNVDTVIDAASNHIVIDGPNPIQDAPVFINPAEEDFRLSAASPLIDAGSCTGAPSRDLDGHGRPFDGDFDEVPACDIGPYEYTPTPLSIRIESDRGLFATGQEVILQIIGTFDAGEAVLTGGEIDVDSAFTALFDPETRRFRPTETPGVYPNAIVASYGDLSAALSVDLACGCPEPDYMDGTPGGCNSVPPGYDSSWAVAVRDVYCVAVDAGVRPNPYTTRAGELRELRPGLRDAFGFVFPGGGPWSVEVVNGAGQLEQVNQFRATLVPGTYDQAIRVSDGETEGTTTVVVGAPPPVSLELSLSTLTIGQLATDKLTVTGYDINGQNVSDDDVVWSLEGDVPATINPRTGRVTAGCETGQFEGAIVASYNDVRVEATLVIFQRELPASRLTLTPDVIDIPAADSVQLTASAFDACDRPKNVQINWGVDAQTGVIDQGLFTASCRLGEYPAGAYAVTSSGLRTNVPVTIGAGRPQAIRLNVDSIAMRVNKTAEVRATTEDQCSVIRPAEALWGTDHPDVTVVAGEGGEATVSSGCALTEDTTLTVTQAGLSASATVSVSPGGIWSDELTIEAERDTVEIGDQLQLVAYGYDECQHPVSGEMSWRFQGFNANGRRITSSVLDGLLQPVCADIGPVTIKATDRLTWRATGLIEITILAGPASRVRIQPEDPSIVAGQTQQFVASLVDNCDTVLSGDASFSATSAGQITSDGLFTADQVAVGLADSAIVATIGDLSASTSVTVVAGPATEGTLDVDELNLTIEESAQLSVTFTDEFGNVVGDRDAEIQYEVVTPEAGHIDEEGLFEAGVVAGRYEDAIRVQLDDIIIHVDVVVRPDVPERINLTASPESVTAGQTSQFSGQVVDRAGNVIEQAVQYAVSLGDGSIDESGLFSAPQRAGDAAVTISSDNVEPLVVNFIINADDPVALVGLTPSSAEVTPNQTVQFTASVVDRFGNDTGAPITWTANALAGDIDESGRFTAGTSAGLYPDGVRATHAALSVDAPITIRPAQAARIELSESELTITAGRSVQLSARVFDEFGNEFGDERAGQITWGVSGDAGQIDASGRLTASETAGIYEGAVIAEIGEVVARLTVTIIPDAAVALNLTTDEIQLSLPAGSAQLSANAVDQYGNTVSDVEHTWSVNGASGLVIDAEGTLRVDCTVAPGIYPAAVTAESGDLSDRADVVVLVGPVASLAITPDELAITPLSRAQLSIIQSDACDNPTTETVEWSSTDGGSIDTDGSFLAGSVASSVTVRARAGSREASSEIHILPDVPVSITLSPDEVTLTVGAEQVFDVEAEDRFGNRWTPDDLVWGADETAGLIDAEGLFVAGTRAGSYPNGVTATLGALMESASVTLIADEAHRVSITPVDPTVLAGQTLQFEAAVLDEHDNQIPDALMRFEVAPEAGEITEDGLFTASINLGTYTDGVRAVHSPDVSASVEISVIAGDPSRVVIAPADTTSEMTDPVTVVAGGSILFSATVYDAAGAEIPEVAVTWSVPESLGDIDVNGLLTVARISGTFDEGVTATIGDVTGSIGVIVPVDFDGDGAADVDELEDGFDPTDDQDMVSDADSDGLSNGDELEAGTDPRDADSDDDGVRDGAEPEWNLDTDMDGLINALDPDSDDDGIRDGTELGLTDPEEDTDRAAGHFLPDDDPTTTTDPLSADTDGDGAADGEEDRNSNGAQDPGETAADSSSPDIRCASDDDCVDDGQICASETCVVDPSINDSDSGPSDEAEAAQAPRSDDGCMSSDSAKLTSWWALLCLVFMSLRRRVRRSTP